MKPKDLLSVVPAGALARRLFGAPRRTHNLGGSVDQYVVDLTCKGTGSNGITNFRVGGDRNGSDYYGAYWSNLTTSQISLVRYVDDVHCSQVRARIWVYP